MGDRKHSFSPLAIFRLFLTGNSFAITVYIEYTQTQLYLHLFLKKKNRRLPLTCSPGSLSFGGRHEEEADTEAVK